MTGGILLLTASGILACPAVAQVVPGTTFNASPAASGPLNTPGDPARILLSQRVDSSILPIDVTPLAAAERRTSFGDRLQLDVLERLPPRFYMNASVETSFRLETNPFQFPTKRKFLQQIFAQTPPPIIALLDQAQQQQINDSIGFVNRDNLAFRVVPNVSGGFVVAPKTRVYANYFMIRDQFFHNTQLNTVAHSISGGLQRDFPIGSRANLQSDFQYREFYALHSKPVFDFLPSLTLSYALTPRCSIYVNSLLQLRGKRYFQAPTKEIDPFYSFGLYYQRGRWAFSSSGTLVQNFRRPFGRSASLPVNSYSWILDFELSRRLTRLLPGLQAFVRAEPIYNFHAHSRPGLAGMDFRLYWGLRMALGKPAMVSTVDQMRKQLQEKERRVSASAGSM